MREDTAAAIRGLRAFADWLEENPEYAEDTMLDTTFNAFAVDRDHLGQWARVLGHARKVFSSSWFYLERNFGGDVKLHVNVNRTQVCRKVQTGTKVVPAVEEHEVPIYEWECDDPIVLGAEDE
jgi:hypothetical protein